MSVSRINEAGLNVNQYGNRNLIINGAMQVAQRGTSITGISTSQNTIDRYRLNTTSVDELAVTVSQDTDTPSGFSKSMKVDVTTAESAIAADERCSIEQRIEAQNLQHLSYGSSDAKTCTLSFFVKSSVAGKYGINIRHHDASVNKGLDYTINSADTWERKEISFTGYTPTAINDDNGIGLWIRWMLIVGTDYQNTGVENAWNGNTTYYTTTGMQSTWGTNTSHNFYLTGVQLEVGDTATDFEHRTFGDELARCQRYYKRISTTSSSQHLAFAYGLNYTSTIFLGGLNLSPEMRTVPSFSTNVFNDSSLVVVRNSNTSNISAMSISGTGASVRLNATSSSLTAGDGSYLQLNDADSYVDFDAEL